MADDSTITPDLERPGTVVAGRGRTLAIGFATAVAMWAVSYVAMMRPGLIVSEALFALTLACIFAGGFVAGRFALPGESGWLAGAKAGLATGLVNLLLIGSLAGGGSHGGSGGEPRDKMRVMAIWMFGNIAISIALGLIGGVVGKRFGGNAHSRTINWFNGFTRVAAVTVFLLLITGGLVTGLEAGMAVPDWPNSFGHNMLLYPLSEMIGGVYYEHAHRLYGMLVGVTAITLFIATLRFDDRGWVRGLAFAYLIMVCIQGYVGGTRVTEKSIPLAIMHGVFAQIVFATIVSIAAVTSTTWRSLDLSIASPKASRQGDKSPDHQIARFLQSQHRHAIILAVMLIVQLGLGALYRHLRRAWDEPPAPLHVLYTHILVATFVVLLGILVGGRAWSRKPRKDEVEPATDTNEDVAERAGTSSCRPSQSVITRILPTLGQILLALLLAQVMLGVSATIAIWMHEVPPAIPPAAVEGVTYKWPAPPPTVLNLVVTTGHQVTGALLLATATLLMLWNKRAKR